jgi:riboflavin transporter FmnP
MSEQNKPNKPERERPAILTRQRVHWIAKTGILTAVAVVLMYLEFRLPLMPEFLKFDFSEVAILLASFSMGPLTGILAELLKNLLHLPATTTSGVGELANFIVGASFVGTAGLIYRMSKSRRGALIGMASGTAVMTVIASLMNLWLMIPFYIYLFHIDLSIIIGMTNAVGNRLVKDMTTLIVYVFVPFNLFKGIIVSLVVGLIYKRLSPLLHR